MRVSEFMHEMISTSGVFGRNKDVVVQFSGKQAYTDGKIINLPSMAMDQKLTQEQILAMRGYVDHEAGHNRHSDMKRIVDFYKRCLSNNKEGLKNLQNCVEDVWMEQAVIEEYPGSWKNLKQTNSLVKGRELKEWTDPDHIVKKVKKQGGSITREEVIAKQEEFLSKPSHDLIGMGIKAADPKYLGTEGVNRDVLNLLPEGLRPWCERWAQDASNCTNTDEAITLAKSIDKFIRENPDFSEPPPGGEGQDGEGEGKGTGGSQGLDPDDFDPTQGEGEPEGEIDKSLTDKEALEGTGHDGEASGAGQALCEEGDEASGAIGGMDGPLKSKGYRVASTKEDKVWVRGVHGAYRNAKIVNSVDHHLYDEVKNKTSSSIRTMKNKLRRSLMAKMQKRTVHAKEYGRLDSKRLVSAFQREPNVYKQMSDTYELDTAVTILVDLSGSMGGNKVRVARDCAVALAECLEGSGIHYKIVGFSNNGSSGMYSYNTEEHYHRYERTDTTIFKNYDVPLRKCRASVAQIDNAVGSNNSDYDFIAQELAILKQRDQTRKVLFVLSDGHPAHDSDADVHEIIKHCKTAISTAKREGVECVGIGIKDNSVERIYDNCVVVQNVNELSGTVFNKLTDLLVQR